MDYKEELAQIIAAAVDMPAGEILPIIEMPPDPELGDYAFPCFRLAKALRKAPPVIAADILKRLTLPPFVANAKIVGAYINFFLDRRAFY